MNEDSAVFFAIYIAIRSDGKSPGAYPGAYPGSGAYTVPETPRMTTTLTAKSNCYSRFNNKQRQSLIQISLHGKSDIHNIERYNQILVIIYLLKSINDTWLSPNIPYPFLVGNAIGKDHSLLVDDWQLRSFDC